MKNYQFLLFDLDDTLLDFGAAEHKSTFSSMNTSGYFCNQGENKECGYVRGYDGGTHRRACEDGYEDAQQCAAHRQHRRADGDRLEAAEQSHG